MRKAALPRPEAVAVPGAAEPAAGADRGSRAAPQRAPMPVVAKLLERGFRAAAAQAVADTHAAGLPVATIDGQGRPVWRHPDGTLEPMTDPTRIPVRP